MRELTFREVKQLPQGHRDKGEPGLIPGSVTSQPMDSTTVSKAYEDWACWCWRVSAGAAPQLPVASFAAAPHQLLPGPCFLGLPPLDLHLLMVKSQPGGVGMCSAWLRRRGLRERSQLLQGAGQQTLRTHAGTGRQNNLGPATKRPAHSPDGGTRRNAKLQLCQAPRVHGHWSRRFPWGKGCWKKRGQVKYV